MCTCNSRSVDTSADTRTLLTCAETPETLGTSETMRHQDCNQDYGDTADIGDYETLAL